MINLENKWKYIHMTVRLLGRTHELKKAEARAKKNPEDLHIRNLKFTKD